MYDFIDLGCGNGSSINHFKNVFGYDNHLGIDNSKIDIDKALSNGYNVILGDIIETEYPKCKFITSYHVLEHLFSLEEVETVIKKASESATDFIYCIFPNFDDDDELELLGLKFTWSDWKGHPTKIKTEDIIKIADKLGLKVYCGKLHEVTDSNHSEIIPLSSPPNLVSYSQDLGEKQHIMFKWLYKETAFLIPLRELEYLDELLLKLSL